MGNPVPIQERSVDPYASYDSSEINKISRIVSNSKDVILKSSPLVFNIDNDTNVSLVPGGGLIKDDVIINLEGLVIDFADNDFYVNDSLGHWSEDGNYYIVLEYVYSKSRPAPVASIKIILPSQRSNPAIFNVETHMLLKIVNVLTEGGTRKIKQLNDFDSDNPSIAVPSTSNGTKSVASDTYTITNEDKSLILSGTNDKTITLISCKLCENVSILNLNDSIITILPAMTETIDNKNNYIFKVKNTNLNLISDKINNWALVSNQTISEPVFYDQNIIDITINDDIVVSEHNNPVTVNLPLASDAIKPLTIVNKTGDLITISSNGTDLLNGSVNDILLENQYDSINLIPYNGGWIYTVQSQTAGGIDTNELKVSSNDTTPSFLENKIVAGANITLNVLNDGANETLQIVGAAGGAGSSQVKVSVADTTEEYLENKIVAGANVTVTKGDVGGVEYLSISSSAGGGSTLILTNITANYTALVSDSHIVSKATSDIIIDLYSASVCVQELKIINLSPNNSKIDINVNGTDTIEGSSQISLLNKHDSISLVSDQVDTWLEV